MSLKKSFEKELKNKLLMKTVGNQSEEMALLKAFKYFDLANTNICDKNTFIKTVNKIGITGFTDQNISSVFDYYDTDNTGKINYKDFIGILYNNPSIMDNPKILNESPKEEDSQYRPSGSRQGEQQRIQNSSIENIIDTIRRRIKMRGIRCLISLENNFRALDDDNSQTVDYDAFETTSEDFRFGISFDELQNLFYFLDKEKNGRIDYDEFVRLIRGEMSNSRKQLVEDIFETLKPDKDGFIFLKKLYRKFIPENHPDVLLGKKTPKEVYKEFVDTFEGNHTYLNGDEAQFGNVDIDEFCDYYESISFLVDEDSDFENLVRGVWLNELNNQEEDKSRSLKAKKVKKYSDKKKQNEYDNVSNDIKDSHYGNASENLREKKDEKQKAINKGFESFKKYLQQKDVKTVLTLARHFKIMDESGNKTIDFGEFCKGMKNAGLDIPEDVLQELFSDFDYEGSGLISYDEFMDKLLGNLNSRREAVVRAAFNKIDLDKSGVVELNEVKSSYSTKNNPQVLNGEINEEQLYTHFIETFGNHHNLFSGIRDKRVTWKEFLDYYRFISFNILDDDLFEATLVAAWRLENTGEYIKSQRDEDKKKQRMIEQSMGEKQESMRGRKNNTSVRGGGAPFGLDQEPNDYSTSYNDNSQKLRAGRKQNNNEQMNIKDNDNIYKKPDRNQFKKAISPGEEVLNKLKDIIRQRGSVAILGMRRCFMIYDEDNKRVLSFDNFCKYITNFFIPISRNDAIALFKLYDNKNTGEINYDSLINDLLFKMSESRRYLVKNAFNKLDENRKGVLHMNVIKGGFVPKGHPDVKNGKKTEQEVFAEFLDNFDYHFNLLNQGRNPEDEEVTSQEFIDFYRYISSGIEDDNYFNKMIIGVWGLNNLSSNSRRYY